MGFLSKVGKAFKKAVKPLAKVAGINPLIPGGSGSKLLSKGSAALAPVVASVASIGAIGGGGLLSSATAQPISGPSLAQLIGQVPQGVSGILSDTLSHGTSLLNQAAQKGLTDLQCSLFGCPETPKGSPPTKSLAPASVFGDDVTVNVQPTDTMNKLLLYGGIAFAAWYFLIRKK